jgi:hypothetical protein
MLPKARFDIHSLRWTTRIKDRRTSCQGRRRTGARPTHRFNVCARLAVFNKPKLLQIAATSSRCFSGGPVILSEGQWSRRLTNPNLLPNVRPVKVRPHVRADDGLFSKPPYAQKVSPARFDIPPTVWTTASKDRRTSCRGPQGPGARPHTRFQRARRFGLTQAKTPPKFAVTSSMFLSRG